MSAGGSGRRLRRLSAQVNSSLQQRADAGIEVRSVQPLLLCITTRRMARSQTPSPYVRPGTTRGALHRTGEGRARHTNACGVSESGVIVRGCAIPMPCVLALRPAGATGRRGAHTVVGRRRVSCRVPGHTAITADGETPLDTVVYPATAVRGVGVVARHLAGMHEIERPAQVVDA